LYAFGKVGISFGGGLLHGGGETLERCPEKNAPPGVGGIQDYYKGKKLMKGNWYVCRS